MLICRWINNLFVKNQQYFKNYQLRRVLRDLEVGEGAFAAAFGELLNAYLE